MRVFLITLSVMTIVFALLAAIGYGASLDVAVEAFDFSSDTPVTFAHVSDLHYPNSFLSLGETASLIESAGADAILFTGDIADASASERELEALQTFFQRLTARFPCFLVVGNHEIGSVLLEKYLKTAEKAGVTVLNNTVAIRSIRGRSFAFLGLSDGYTYEEQTFSSLPSTEGKTKILLSHRPEKLDNYSSAHERIRPDFVFAGHAHGGGARLGDLSFYAPDQGIFPRYTSGVYEKNGVKMIVSRGLGVSGVDFRWFNKYHLPVVTV